jgi:ribosomal protein S18 acetylase RimI-like enzyme
VNKLIKANTETHYESAISLFKEYAAWLNIDLCFQNFDAELTQLNEMYAAPMGIILLYISNEKYVGCVAVRNKGELIAELKRMYVQPAQRGKGVAKELLLQAIDFAKDAGYKKIRLDTLATMHPAINLYKQFGFYEIAAYYHNPEANAVFFEKEL